MINFLLSIAVMLSGMVEILDMTITNVALPHMMGSLGANIDQITWIMSAYIIAAAIGMPLTGYLSDRFGQKNLLIASLMGFLVTSVLCGAANNLTQIVIFRIIQGAFGACLIPLSQVIMVGLFENKSKAMALWGMGIMVAPVMGPTLGGYITDHLGWRWIFYINVPICGLAAGLLVIFLTDNGHRIRRSLDKVSFCLMALGIGLLQTFFDRGQQENWFESPFIVLCLISGLALTLLFILKTLRSNEPLVDLKLFTHRPFASASALVLPFSLGIFAPIAVTSILFESVLGYSPSQTGLLIAPRGLTSAIGMFLLAKFNDVKISPRLWMLIGTVFSGYGFYQMSYFNASTPAEPIVTAMMIQGFGMGMFFVPNANAAFEGLPASKQASAAGVFALVRSIGNSIGVALASTMLTRNMTVHWHLLSEHLKPFLPLFDKTLAPPVLSATPFKPVLSDLAPLLSQQAMMLSFIDIYRMVGLIFVGIFVTLIVLLAREYAPQIEILKTNIKRQKSRN